jgi:DNA-binding response OmpR family regulator
MNGDQDRLIQVVINLISNAVKFTDSGSIACVAHLQGDELVVSVKDSGIGIAAADQGKVFEKFKQVGDTLTDKPKGTGLGLPICKEIVEYHGGRIWVESAPGKGSTFLFTLPVTAKSAQLSLLPEKRSLDFESLVRQLRETVAGQNGRSKSVLVVDDDPNIRSLLQQELTEAGYGVRLAEDGRKALALVREETPGLVILDVMMPDMNGFDVAAVLKNDPATMDIPIIILSIVEDKERGFRLGVDRYLTKPIDTQSLFHEVDSLLGQGKSKKKVMVVDEDASTIRTLTDVLEARGYQVVDSDGKDLVTRAVTSQPDIIILNSLLSGSDGVRSLRFEKGMENVLFLIYS